MKIKESWFKDYLVEEDETITETYLETYREYLENLSPPLRYKECLSGFNRIRRSKMWSGSPFGIEPRIGDICYFDFGQAFINEAGYQHFGLVIAEFNYKLLVIPMTSNEYTINQARNKEGNQKPHLYFLGKIKGLNKPSVLFLNDLKFINSARIISINGHIEEDSVMFLEIRESILSEIFSIPVLK